MICLLVVAGISFIIWLYSNVNPESSQFMPQCMFYKLTGWKCVGCGTQRAVHHLLHGDFSGAIRYNLFILISFPVIAMLIVAEILRMRYPRFYLAIHSGKFVAVILSLGATWWILRNLIGM